MPSSPDYSEADSANLLKHRVCPQDGLHNRSYPERWVPILQPWEPMPGRQGEDQLVAVDLQLRATNNLTARAPAD